MRIGREGIKGAKGIIAPVLVLAYFQLGMNLLGIQKNGEFGQGLLHRRFSRVLVFFFFTFPKPFRHKFTFLILGLNITLLSDPPTNRKI